MSTRADLLVLLNPLLDVAKALDLSKPDDAARALAQKFPMSALGDVRALFRKGVVEGWLCDRENAGVKFSRVAKDAGGWSVDVVHMSGPGGAHTHPNGEVDLCFTVDGDPKFDGRPPGWVVYPPGSWHVPTVAGGAMDIVYFLPGGAIRFEDKPTPG